MNHCKRCEKPLVKTHGSQKYHKECANEIHNEERRKWLRSEKGKAYTKAYTKKRWADPEFRKKSNSNQMRLRWAKYEGPFSDIPCHNNCGKMIPEEIAKYQATKYCSGDCRRDVLNKRFKDRWESDPEFRKKKQKVSEQVRQATRERTKWARQLDPNILLRVVGYYDMQELKVDDEAENEGEKRDEEKNGWKKNSNI